MLMPLYGEREARAIVKTWFCGRLNLRPLDLVLQENKRVPFPSFSQDFGRLQAHEPIQYILGVAPFMDMELRVNPSTLIPRPETEELVHMVGRWIPKNELRVIDAGTGSGCIALGLKKLRPNWSIKGIDISAHAVKIARENAASTELDVSFEIVDILNALPSADLVVSNPPYIPVNERSTMDIHVADKEPDRALFVPDDDPLIFYRRLIEQSIAQANGSTVYMAFEIHENFGDEMLDLCRQFQLKEANLKVDFQNKPRFIFAQYDG